MPEHSKQLVADAITYVGGAALVGSMALNWPAPGRRGSDSGIRLIGRISRLARFAGVDGAWLIGPVWFLLPLCGAVLMLLTAIGRPWARNASIVIALAAVAELAVLFHVFGVIGLDRSAGAGFVVASIGALLGVCGVAGERLVGRTPR